MCREMPAGWRSPPAGCRARPTPRSFVQRAPPMASQAVLRNVPHTRGRDVACCLTMCCRSTDDARADHRVSGGGACAGCDTPNDP